MRIFKGKMKIDLMPPDSLPFSGAPAVASDDNVIMDFSDPSGLPLGWVWVRGLLDSEGFGFSCNLLLTDQLGEITSLDLPASLKGNLNEIVFIPKKTLKIQIKLNMARNFRINYLHIQNISIFNRYYHMLIRIVTTYHTQSPAKLQSASLFWYSPLLNIYTCYQLCSGFRAFRVPITYEKWIESFDKLTNRDVKLITSHVNTMNNLPTISVVSSFEACLSNSKLSVSLESQIYKVYSIDTVDTEWILLVETDVVLTRHALYWFANAAMNNPGSFLIYSDHDYLSADGDRINPCFKPDWSIEYLLSNNYIGPVVLVRRDVLSSVVSASSKVSPSCYQVALKCVDMSYESNDIVNGVVHIPSILFHIPEKNDSIESYSADFELVRDFILSNNISAELDFLDNRYNRLVYSPQLAPLVSIIIPTRDTLHHLERCVLSVLEKTTYGNVEIIIVDNQSVEAATFDFFDSLKKYSKVKVVPYDYPFNYSSINNYAVQHSSGEVICLLNNDTEVISENWLEVMLGQLQQPHVGAVGIKLLFANGKVQHAGDAVGPGGCADHFHSKIDIDDPGYMGRAMVAQDLSAVTAACLLTTRDIWEELDGLDAKNLAVAFNDVDFCLRVAEAGYRVVFTPYASMYHHESVSRGKDNTPEKAARAKREANYMRSRWKHIIKNDPFYNPNLNYSRPDFALGCYPIINKPWLKC